MDWFPLASIASTSNACVPGRRDATNSGVTVTLVGTNGPARATDQATAVAAVSYSAHRLLPSLGLSHEDVPAEQDAFIRVRNITGLSYGRRQLLPLSIV